MKITIAALFAICLYGCGIPCPADVPKVHQDVVTFFCPADGVKINAEHLRIIASEKVGIHLEAYTLTDKALIAALVEAAKTVPVIVILDAVYGVKSSGFAIVQLKASKVELHLDAQETGHGGISHPKVLICLGQQIARGGSGNFTLQSRTRNHEVVHFFYGGLTPDQLEIDFQNHLKHSPLAP